MTAPLLACLWRGSAFPVVGFRCCRCMPLPRSTRVDLGRAQAPAPTSATAEFADPTAASRAVEAPPLRRGCAAAQNIELDIDLNSRLSVSAMASVDAGCVGTSAASPADSGRELEQVGALCDFRRLRPAPPCRGWQGVLHQCARARSSWGTFRRKRRCNSSIKCS